MPKLYYEEAYKLGRNLPNYYEKMLNIDPKIPKRRKLWNGTTKKIESAIDELPFSNDEIEKIYSKNFWKLINKF